MLTQGAKMVFIRFNPNLYIDSNGRRKNPEMSTRLNSLKKVIDEQKAHIQNGDNIEMLKVVTLFFDE